MTPKRSGKKRASKTALCLNSAFFGYYAHLGFVRGLEKIGFQPDIVTGCSAGALVGALYCAGIDLEEASRVILGLKKKDFWEGNLFWHLLKPLFTGWKDYTGILSGRRIRDLLYPYLGGLEFDDLEIPLGVAVSNLTKRERELRTTGNVLESVVCSMAFPILMEIQTMDEHHFMDGGVADHEPVKELILDPDVRTIIVHEIFSHELPGRVSALARAFRSGVAIIDRETRGLKELLAADRGKKIVRITTESPALGPDRIHLGVQAEHAGMQSALLSRKKILG